MFLQIIKMVMCCLKEQEHDIEIEMVNRLEKCENRIIHHEMYLGKESKMSKPKELNFEQRLTQCEQILAEHDIKIVYQQKWLVLQSDYLLDQAIMIRDQENKIEHFTNALKLME